MNVQKGRKLQTRCMQARVIAGSNHFLTNGVLHDPTLFAAAVGFPQGRTPCWHLHLANANSQRRYGGNAVHARAYSPVQPTHLEDISPNITTRGFAAPPAFLHTFVLAWM